MIVNYDGDTAGKNAAFRAVPICFEKGMQVSVLALPEGLDPDGFVRKNGGKAYLELAKRSISGLKYLTDTALQTGNMNVPEEKSRIVRSIVSELNKVPDSIVRSEYLRKAAEYLSVDETFLRQIIEKPPATQAQQERDFFLPAEKRLLQILIDNHTVASEVLTKAKEEDFKGLKSEPAFRLLVENHKKGKKAAFPELFRTVEPDLSRCLSQMMQERAEKGTEEEALDCLVSLRKITLESQLRILQKEIVRCERNGEKDRLSRLLSQKQTLTRQIVAM
jgi:DNA primase